MPAIHRITHRLREPAVRDLLSLAVGTPTPEKMEALCRLYADDPARDVIGMVAGDAVTGVLGYQRNGMHAVITHLAVKPLCQRRGIARSLVGHLATVSITSLELETDADAVAFYQRCGFAIESLGETYPGVERFHCTR